MLGRLAGSVNPRIAEIAEKAGKEVAYHLDRSSDLVVRLGDGTPESHAKMQAALDDYWPYVGEMFAFDALESALESDGIAPDLSGMRADWDARVETVMAQAMLQIPGTAFAQKGGKTGTHTEHLGHILADMQFLQRAYPDARW